MKTLSFIVTFATTLLLGSLAQADAVMTYSGRLFDTSGNPIAGQNIIVRLDVRRDSSCYLLRLNNNVITDGDGNFRSTLSTTGSVFSAAAELQSILQNTSSTPLNCYNAAGSTTGSTFVPVSDSAREVIVSVSSDGGTTFEEVDSQSLRPYYQAYQSEQVGGFKADNLLRVANGTTPQSIAALTSAQATNLMSIINGTSTQYERSGNLGGVALPGAAPTAGQSLRMGGSGTWEAYTPAANAGTVTYVGTGTGLQGGPIIGGGTLSLAPVGSGGTGYKVTYDIYGRVTGSAALAEGDIPNLTTAGKVSGNSITSGTISGTTSINTSGTVAASQVSTRGVYISNLEPKTISILAPAVIAGSGYTLTLPDSGGITGQVLTTNGTGGLSWTSPAAGSVTSVVATAPIMVTGTSAVTVSVGDATTSTKGVVQLATSGGTTAGRVVQADDPRLSDARTTSGTAGGDLTGSYPVPRVAAIRNVAVNATAPTGAGQVLRYNGATEYAPAYLSLADIRSTTGPTYAQAFPSTSCTAKQTLTWLSITDTLACSDIILTAADITNAVINGGQSGTVRVGSNDSNILALRTSNTDRLAIDATGNVVVTTGSLNVQSGNFNIGGLVAIDNLGNFRPPIGTASSPSLTFGTNTTTGLFSPGSGALAISSQGTERMRIESGGNVGIGLNSPSEKLDVSGRVKATGFCMGADCRSSWYWQEAVTNKIYYSGGNVGVGTIPADSARLHVKGATGSPSVILNEVAHSTYAPTLLFRRSRLGTFPQTNDVLGAVKFGSYNSDVETAAAANTGLYALATETHDGSKSGSRLDFKVTPNLTNGVATAMTIDQNSNVGIGTTSPFFKLDIQGDDSNPEMRVMNTSSTTARFPAINVTNYSGGFGGEADVNLVTSRGSLGSPAPVQANDFLGAIVGWGQWGSTAGQVGPGAHVGFYAAGNFTSGSYPTNIGFYTAPAGSTARTQRMVITSGGSVGINAASPAATLDINGSVKLGSAGTPFNGMQTGTIGTACAINSGSLGSTSGSVTFSTAFASAPRILLTPETVTSSTSTCSSVRITARSATGFSWASFSGATLSLCDCIHWMAIGN